MVLISFDFLKAFDTVEWDSIYAALQAFGFRPKFIHMIKIIYTDPLVCASNNGYWSDFFSPTRATRQGCCISPMIFNIIVELLGLGIRQNVNIKGVHLNKQETKAGQYADDLWATLLANENNVNETLKEIESFGNFSGLRLNYDKCAILKMGPFKDTDAQFYTLKQLYWSPGPIRILGIEIHTNPESRCTFNFYNVLDKVQKIIGAWTHRNITVMGKITVVNSLIHTLFVHKLLSLETPPEAFFVKYKKTILDFIWDDKPAKIAYEKLIQNYGKMGLKLTDLPSKDTSLKAAWPIRWANKDTTELSWFFEHLPIKDQRIWECNIKIDDVKKLARNTGNCNSVAYSIWAAWS